MKWIHRLLNPHCADCKLERFERVEREALLKANELSREIELSEFNLKCYSCESHIREINFLRQQVKDLQDYILHPSVSIEPTVNTDDLKPLQSSRKPFSIIRNELEQADRLKAKQLDEQILANAAAKADVSPIVNDEGKVDINLVNKELENMNQEIKHG